MCWIISTIWGLILLWEIIKWFFAVALPWFFGHLGEFVEWVRDQISRFLSWSATTWRTLASGCAASSGREGDATQAADKSLLESADNPDINLPSQPNPTSAMWPFGSDNKSASSGSSPSPRQGVSLTAPELDKLKAELYKAQNQVKTLEVTIKSLNLKNAALESAVREKQELNQSMQERFSQVTHALATLESEFQSLIKRHDSVSAELEALKPFAAIKTDQRRMIYTVSPELHKKWQSIMRDTTRLQVLELLGQPTEILAVSSGGASPIQLVRKGVPAPRPELMQHVTNLVVGDGLLKDWVRGVGRTAWVYAEDTLAPGVIFFASESDGGQVFRIFPPEC